MSSSKGTDAPGGIIRLADGTVAGVLARRVVRGPRITVLTTHQMHELAHRDMHAGPGPQQVRRPRPQHAAVRVRVLNDCDDTPVQPHADPDPHIANLHYMAALHPARTPRTVDDVDVEPPTIQRTVGDVFLILRPLAAHDHPAPAARTGRRHTRPAGLVERRWRPLAPLPHLRRSLPPVGTSAATFSPGLRNGGGTRWRLGRRSPANSPVTQTPRRAPVRHVIAQPRDPVAPPQRPADATPRALCAPRRAYWAQQTRSRIGTAPQSLSSMSTLSTGPS